MVEKDFKLQMGKITKRFRNFTAVDNFTLDIRTSEIIVFLGPNGAGKSPTMKMLA